jgi:hypothetical protein
MYVNEKKGILVICLVLVIPFSVRGSPLVTVFPELLETNQLSIPEGREILLLARRR